MADHGTLMITGVSGTVGKALLNAVTGQWPGPILAIGRRWPADVQVDRFLETDLADEGALARACAALTATQPPVTGLLLAAGVDCRSTLATATNGEYRDAFAVNCVAPLRLLAAAATAAQATDPDTPLRAVVVSSDVVTKPQPATLVYAAAKTALDSAVQHAATDHSHLRVLLLRLPELGTPMTDVHNNRPCRTAQPSPALPRASDAAARFLLDPVQQASVRIWTDA